MAALLAFIATSPATAYAFVFLVAFFAFVATVLAGGPFSLNSLEWYNTAVAFWNNYVVEPAVGLSAWIPLNAIATLLTWWLAAFGVLFTVRVARFVLGITTGGGS